MTSPKKTDISLEVGMLAKGAGVSLFAKLGSRALQLAVQVLLARLLGPAGFGLFALGQVIFQLGAQLGTLGIPAGIIRFGVPARQKDDRALSEVLYNAFFIAFISGVFFCVLIIVLAPWLAQEVFNQKELVNVLRGFAIAAMLNIYLQASAAATRVTRRMHYSAFALDILPFLLNLFLVFILIYFLKLSTIGAVLALIAGSGIGLVVSLYYVHKLFSHTTSDASLSLTKIREIFSFSLPNSLAGIFNLWLPNITILILGYYAHPKDVGLFQAAEQISTLSAIILLSFNTIISPMISDLYERREIKKLDELFKVSTKWGLYISLPLLIVIAFYSSTAMGIVYGTNYASGARLLLLLMLAQFVNLATGSVAPLLSMTGHQNTMLFRTGIAFLICLISNIFLTPVFGSTGATLSMGMGIIALNLQLLWEARRLLKIWPYDGRYFKLLPASIITGFSVFILHHFWTAPGFGGLVVITLFSLSLFWVILILLKLDSYEYALLYRVADKYWGRKIG